jgi:predicted ATPase/class 3 adenylate cyclase
VSARMHLPEGLVTFLFTDIEGSTRLAQMLGAEYRVMLNEHRGVLRAAFESLAGTEMFTEGDSIFFAFPDAAAALHACGEAQRGLARHDWPVAPAPRVRMGLHTGYAYPRAGEYASPEVHRAARIAAAAHGGQVLCSEATAEHAGIANQLIDLGLYRLRGFDRRERLFQLAGPGLEHRFPRPRGALAAGHNLPMAVTTFVGRTAELAELRGLLASQRLVSVVGPAGAGKTRLAVELALGAVDKFPDGVWFLDLAGIDDADDVEAGVAEAMGIGAEPGRPLARTIVDHVVPRRMLLLLDTCDAHPVAAAALVERLLAATDDTTIVVTSREPLGLAGEPVWRISPLTVPRDGPSDAVTLLLDRASAARGGRAVLPEELADLVRVANATDGLPLALELAAARLRVLSTSQLAGRLHDVLAVLDAGRAAPEAAAGLRAHNTAYRHRTMEAAVDWSYRTLPADAARLLRWLSVFAGPVELSTVEHIFGADPLDAVVTLVDKSLLQADGGAYRVLDAFRGYAARRLRDEGEEHAVRDRHVEWCVREVREAQRHRSAVSLRAWDPLRAELNAALHWTVNGGDADAGLALMSETALWWCERGRTDEARTWLDRLYEQTPAPGAAVYLAHSMLAGGTAEALEFAGRAEEVATDAGSRTRAIARRAAILLDAGRTAEAETAARQTIDTSGHPGDALDAVFTLALVLWQRGDLDDAAALLAGARPVETAQPIRRVRRCVDLFLGLVAISRGDLVAAHEHLVAALRARLAGGFDAGAVEALAAMAARCAASGDDALAARLFGAAQMARAQLRVPAGMLDRYWRVTQVSIRASIGDAVFDTEYAEGCALSLADASALALTVEHPDLALDSGRFDGFDVRRV